MTIDNNESIEESQSTLHAEAINIQENFTQATLPETDEATTIKEEKHLEETIIETMIETIADPTPEVQCQFPVEDNISLDCNLQTSSQVPEEVVKLEQQISDILVLHEELQLKKEQEDIIKDEEQIPQQFDGDATSEKELTTIEVKDEAKIETKIESFEELMDIEDDAPFVRRSRRLQSIHLDTFTPSFPIKTEDNSSMLGASSSVEKRVAQMSLDMNMSTPDMEQNNGDLQSLKKLSKQEETGKTVQEVRTKVEHTDIRLKRYETIRDNIYSKKSDKKVCKVNKTMKCDCTITEEEVKSGEMGCQYNCINRILYIECGLKCRCGGNFRNFS